MNEPCLIILEQYPQPGPDLSQVSCPDQLIVVEDTEAQKWYSPSQRDDLAFCRMQLNLELFEKLIDPGLIFLKPCCCAVKDDKIVNVADIILCLERVFDEPVHLMEIDVCEELAGPVAQRHALARGFRIVVVKNCFHQP